MTEQRKCPDASRVRAFLENKLSDREQADLASHLADCETCRSSFEELAEEGGLLSKAAKRQIAEQGDPDKVLKNVIDHLRAKGPGDALTGDITEAQQVTMTDVSLDFLKPSDSPEYLGRLDSYEIIEVIGRGGMGIVLKGYDPRLKRCVAIKVLTPQLASNGAARKRFLREAQAAAAVSHDHVVPIYAVDETDGLPYIVMECILGVSLAGRIKRSGPLRLQEILRVGMQAASGLAAAHAQGLVHRDIKPDNILLENGVERVRITDFGLARAADDVQITQTGVVAGTPEYMSPEQTRGKVVDHRSDLFSLGCVLYAMCTGRSPFRASTIVDAIRRVCEDSPRPIREVNSEIPEWLVEITDRLLAKNVVDRFQTAEEVAELLGRHLAHLQRPADIPRPGPLPQREPHEKPTRSGTRGWKLPAVLAACAALLTGVVLMPLLVTGVWSTHDEVISGSNPMKPVDRTKRESLDNFLFIDLGSVANVALDEATSESGSNLSDLEPGIEYFGEVPFKIGQKYVLLSGIKVRDLPDQVGRIHVNAYAERLHFFHGVMGGTREGETVIEYVVHYDDGRRETVPVLYGKDIRDCLVAAPKWPERGELAWVGTNDYAARKNLLVHFFRRTWENPRPEAKIAEIAIRNVPETGVAPACAAMTAELPKEASSPREDGELSVKLHSGSFRLVLHGQQGRMTFIGGDRRKYRIQAGRYQADIVLQTPSEEIVFRTGTVNIAPNRTVSITPPFGSSFRRHDAPQPEPKDELPGQSEVWDLAVSPDGRTFVTATADGTVHASKWKETRNGETTPLKYHGDVLRKIVFSPQGDRIAVGSMDGTISICDTADYRLLTAIEAHEEGVYGLAFSPDGKTLASGGPHDPRMKLWDPQTGELISEFDAHQELVYKIAFSADGSLAATSGGSDGALTVWDALTWKKRFSVTASSGDLADLAFSADGRYVATAGRDGGARLWDATNGKLINTFWHNDALNDVAFLEAEGTLFAAGNDGVVPGWDLDSGEMKCCFCAHWGPVRSIAVTPDGSSLITGSLDHTTRMWNISELPETSPVAGPSPESTFFMSAGHPAIDLEFSPSGSLLATRASRGQTKVWDLKTGRLQHDLGVLWGPLFGMAFSPDSKTLIVSIAGKNIQCFDTDTFKSTAHSIGGKPYCIALTPDGGKAVVVHSFDERVELWDKNFTERYWSAELQHGSLSNPSVSPDGTTILLGAVRAVPLLDTATGKPKSKPLVHGKGGAHATAFSPDGESLATGGGDKLVRIWRVSDLSQIHVLEGHIGEVMSVHFSPDGKLLVTADVSDMMEYLRVEIPQHAGKIIVWDVETGESLVDFTVHNGAVIAAEFSPNGKKIASTGRDGRVHIWDVGKLLEYGAKTAKDE